MPEDKIDKVSNALAAAWRNGDSVNVSEDLWPMSFEESMAIQDAFDAKIAAVVSSRPRVLRMFCLASTVAEPSKNGSVF